MYTIHWLFFIHNSIAVDRNGGFNFYGKSYSISMEKKLLVAATSLDEKEKPINVGLGPGSNVGAVGCNLDLIVGERLQIFGLTLLCSLTCVPRTGNYDADCCKD